MVPHWILRVHVFLANQGGLPPEEITLPEVLRDEGYTNALIGRSQFKRFRFILC